MPLFYTQFYTTERNNSVQTLVDIASKAQQAQWKVEESLVHDLCGLRPIWMLYFYSEAAPPCINAAGGNCDLISSALEILAAESSRVDVSKDGPFGHTRTARDFGGFEVLLDRRKGTDDVDQLRSRLIVKRPSNLFSTLP